MVFSGGAPIAPIKEYIGDRGFKTAGAREFLRMRDRLDSSLKL
jgi:hypothetical protein